MINYSINQLEFFKQRDMQKFFDRHKVIVSYENILITGKITLSFHSEADLLLYIMHHGANN